MDNVKLDELTRPEVQSLLNSGAVDTVVITIGSTEQHGLHLPLGTDALLADAAGEGLAKGLGKALLAPPIRVGCSDHHMAFSGTISIRVETLAHILSDYVGSLARHGFKNIVIIPTHGGNFRPLASIVGALRAANPQVNIVAYTDLGSFMKVMYRASGEFEVSPEASGGHAGESETSMILALRPELVQMDRAVPGYVGTTESTPSAVFAQGIDALNADGIIGDPCSATAEKGRVYLQRLVDHLEDIIRPQLK